MAHFLPLLQFSQVAWKMGLMTISLCMTSLRAWVKLSHAILTYAQTSKASDQKTKVGNITLLITQPRYFRITTFATFQITRVTQIQYGKAYIWA
jgi:hypothetical protein